MLPPNRQFKKVHEQLNDWKSLIKEPNNKAQISWLYNRLVGSLTNIANFKPKYKKTIQDIKSEYKDYLKNLSD